MSATNSDDRSLRPPAPADVAHLRPGWAHGTAHVLTNAVTLWLALSLSTWGGWFAYFVGQLLLAWTFVHAFMLLHEAGHHTLFQVAAQTAGRPPGRLRRADSVPPVAAYRCPPSSLHRLAGPRRDDGVTRAARDPPVGARESSTSRGAPGCRSSPSSTASRTTGTCLASRPSSAATETGAWCA